MLDNCLPPQLVTNGFRLQFVPYSNFVRAIPVPDKQATTVARALFNDVFLQYGFLAVLQTDLRNYEDQPTTPQAVTPPPQLPAHKRCTAIDPRPQI